MEGYDKVVAEAGPLRAEDVETRPIRELFARVRAGNHSWLARLAAPQDTP